MKKILTSLFFVFAFLLGINGVKANTITNINMDIYIDQDGNAHVKETWNANLTSGTEGYRYYDNLGNSEIIDYEVTSSLGDYTSYDSYNDWNINASFSDKSYKYGINDAGDHKELCFGISKYGSNTYTLSYTITNFVSQLDDAQMAYWELIPNDLAKLTNKVYIKIYADEEFADDLDVWGYGNYGGYAYVYDGYIEMSNDSLKSDEYMTILIKFPSETFNTNNVLNHDFDYYLEMSKEGSKKYKDKSSIISVIFGIISMIFNFGIWIIVAILVAKTNKNASLKSGSKVMNYGKTGKKVSNDVPLFREIPCNKDIYRAYWIAKNYNLMSKDTDFLGAIILKWLKQNKIRVENNTVGKVFKKEDTTIVFSDETCTLDNELESKLYGYMYEASKDGILESKEFERWCSSNYRKILGWFDKVLDYENDILISEGKLSSEEVVKLGIFKSTVYNVDPSMMEEAKQLKGLKKFFNEFENMKDKEAIDVHLWEEYLMFAQILGVAEKVAKQFKKLYPDAISDYSYESVVFVHNISRTGMVSASSARSRAQSYSSGGGGFSSGGGGGGSFGGGGGGGFR